MVASNRQYLIGANWKCNLVSSSVKSLTQMIGSAEIPVNCEVCMAPPNIYIPIVLSTLNTENSLNSSNSLNASINSNRISIAAQDCGGNDFLLI